MPEKKDYYEVLGVPKDSSEKDLKGAYRKLAMKYHPDRSEEPDAEEKFKELSEAYAVLSDPEKRKKYDQFGPDFERMGGFPGGQRMILPAGLMHRPVGGDQPTGGAQSGS